MVMSTSFSVVGLSKKFSYRFFVFFKFTSFVGPQA